MAMQPLLQAGLSTGVGLKKAESSFTASDSDLQTPSSAVTTLGSVSPHTLRDFRRSNLGGLRGKAERGRPGDPPYSTRREPRSPPSFWRLQNWSGFRQYRACRGNPTP